MENQFNIARIYDKKDKPTNLFTVDFKGIHYTLSKDELNYFRMLITVILKET